MLLLVLGCSTLLSQSVSAESLRIQPLSYQTVLGIGERQKGFVDITNPTAQTVTVTTSVQAFRQVDDKGSLQFYNDAAVINGVTPDLSEFELGARETVRMYFIIDGTKLPSGDVFAALFATIKPQASTGTSQQAVRVGTILSIVNGTPGARQATITHMLVGFFQFDTKITGTYTIKNTADMATTTGFYPKVTVGISPLKQQQVATSKLVYAGRSRDNSFQLETARLGLYRVTVSYLGSSESQLVFIVSGWWRLVVLGVVVGGGVLWWWLKRHKLHR